MRRDDEGYLDPMTDKYDVNDRGVAKARQMIESNQYDTETEWSDGQASTEESNDKIDRDGYEGYGEWHLALDTEASEKTKDRYGFPYGDFKRVYRSALIHAKQRASQNDHHDVEKAADDLLDHLDEVAAQ